MQGYDRDHRHRSHSVLPVSNELLGSFSSPWSSSSLSADLPTSDQASPDVGTSPKLQFLHRVAVPFYFFSSFSRLLYFVLPSYAGIYLVLLGVWGPLLMFSRCFLRTLSFQIFPLPSSMEIGRILPIHLATWILSCTNSLLLHNNRGNTI